MNADVLFASVADRYRLVRELGTGGMATVFLAADLTHDRTLAIDMLKPELAAVLERERQHRRGRQYHERSRRCARPCALPGQQFVNWIEELRRKLTEQR